MGLPYSKITYKDICVLADATIGVRFDELSDCGPRIGSFDRHNDGWQSSFTSFVVVWKGPLRFEAWGLKTILDSLTVFTIFCLRLGSCAISAKPKMIDHQFGLASVPHK